MQADRLIRHLALTALALSSCWQHAHAQVTHTIDVLGIYSEHTAQRVSDPAALFVRNIEYANRALANSQANFRYNLVHVQQQNWASDDSLGSSQLRSFAEDEVIKALRVEYGADLVAGIVPSSSGLCGIGYLPSSSDGLTLRRYSRNYAYSLSGDDCGGRTMAHEMGHNTGLGHSAAQGSSGTFGRWARGHGVDRSFVTVMAYSGAYGVYTSAGRVQVHSNPDISTCQGQPCGVEYTLSDGADAVRSLNMASSQIADYTPSVDGPINRPPEAVDDSLTTDEGLAAVLNVLSNDSDPDSDPLTLVSVTQPSNGAASVQSSSGDVRYTPRNGFFGNDRFDYRVRDGAGEISVASVLVTVNEIVIEPPPDGNLVVNGDAQNGLAGWQGIWGTTLSLATPGLEGSRSVQANGGYAAAVELVAPFAAGRVFSFSASISASEDNIIYAYLRILRDGQWRYQFLTGGFVQSGVGTELRTNAAVGGGEVSDGILMFYSPYALRGDVLIDTVRLEPQ